MPLLYLVLLLAIWTTPKPDNSIGKAKMIDKFKQYRLISPLKSPAINELTINMIINDCGSSICTNLTGLSEMVATRVSAYLARTPFIMRSVIQKIPIMAGTVLRRVSFNRRSCTPTSGLTSRFLCNSAWR